ncbi:MAG: S-adenosylmethionine decarboxylase related protein, partial [Clostridium sp.]
LLLSNKDDLKLYAKEASKELHIGRITSSFFTLNTVGTTIIINLEKGQLILTSNNITLSVTVFVLTDEITIDLHPTFRYIYNTLKAKTYISEFTLNQDPPKEVIIKNPLFRLPKAATISNSTLSILGSSGGVASSMLSILNLSCMDENDPLNKFISGATLHLIDINQKDICYYEERYKNLKGNLYIHQFDLNDIQKLTDHLLNTSTSIVVDMSFADTVDTLRICDSLGIIYINSAFESVAVDENDDLQGFPLQERYKIFESHREEFKNTTSIICSGMNPGVVQWMAIELMKQNNNEVPNGCYIVEEDTSFFEDEALCDKNTIYTTWSPECFLDEAIYSYPNYVKKHQSLFLYKEVYEIEFKVTLGEKVFYGSLMPHEEALTLGKMYDMETGFIYKVNDHTTNIIVNNLDDLDSLWDMPMEVLSPEKAQLKGEDLVGVLLVYDEKEVFMYNTLTNKETFKKYGTNATYLQVASGLYGALCSIVLDSLPKGIFYIDELLTSTNSNYGEYLSYHLEKFVVGENKNIDGDLLNRMRERN